MKQRIDKMEPGDVFETPEGIRMIKIKDYKYRAIDTEYFRLFMFMVDSIYEVTGHIGPDGQYVEAGK